MPINDSCILQHLNKLNEITKVIHFKGYVTARIVLIQLGIYGELGLDIIEGEIEAIVGDSETVNVDLLFPNSVGNPINLKDLEQGIDQANRLPSNKISMRLLSENTGEEVSFSVKSSSFLGSQVMSIDNHGYKSAWSRSTREQ